MLTDSLKSKMPATSLQLFGIKQIEEDNMAACEYSTDFLFLKWDVPQIIPQSWRQICCYHKTISWSIKLCLFHPYDAILTFTVTPHRIKAAFRSTILCFSSFRSAQRGASHTAPLCCQVRSEEADHHSPSESRGSASLQRDEQARRLPKHSGREEWLLRTQTVHGRICCKSSDDVCWYLYFYVVSKNVLNIFSPYSQVVMSFKFMSACVFKQI